jgi:PadR family transcriptional regulator, regulatory protein AphA
VALRYAILGQLSTTPCSGYDLALYLDSARGGFWCAAHSQIYPELRRLEDAGLIEGAPEVVGEKLEKRVYSITDAGADLLATWAAGAPIYRPNRDPERLQLIFADRAPLEAIRQHLEAHRDRFGRQRAQIDDVRQAILSRAHERVETRLRGRSGPEQELSLLLRDLAYSGDRERAAHEVDWADRALALLDAYEQEHIARAGPTVDGDGAAWPQ